MIKLSPRRSLGERLEELHATAAEILEEHRPSAIAIEDLFHHYERPRTAILMGHARGVLFLAAAQLGVEVSGYLPTKVKKHLTGSGRANKEQMQLAIQAQFGLAEPPQPSDVADALAIALCHLNLLRCAG
ncbi:Crossover junction endodeoxyribonuclease RuvC [Planctomycetes bacterium Pan216]|uniref:Crossover junction endodeoxyribonuclease RuvC n=1 Tax=Kolteria novifilia TaxID=2527975 RepID=A0A518B503_9BACT|nr:Crossover junction endodeoxyribonuclease RuvC [Planctomycetes bacterium Pan216]